MQDMGPITVLVDARIRRLMRAAIRPVAPHIRFIDDPLQPFDAHLVFCASVPDSGHPRVAISPDCRRIEVRGVDMAPEDVVQIIHIAVRSGELSCKRTH